MPIDERYAPVIQMPTAASVTEVRMTSSTGGEKGSKDARFDLIPVGPLTDVARLYGFGAKKYADRNWEKGYDWSLSYAALMRHVTQFWNGEDVDSETQISHLASVVFHALAMMEWSKTHPEFDNRPKPLKMSDLFKGVDNGSPGVM